jgi:hypothetical protein
MLGTMVAVAITQQGGISGAISQLTTQVENSHIEQLAIFYVIVFEG